MKALMIISSCSFIGWTVTLIVSGHMMAKAETELRRLATELELCVAAKE